MATKEETQDLTREAEALYVRYVKPLEKDRYGEYIAVSRDGKVVLAPSLLDVMEKAEQELEPGNFLFKVGDIAVDTWR
jgi:pyruvate/2-oxoacid:ferredoxin oxidoreductase alpha subunit